MLRSAARLILTAAIAAASLPSAAVAQGRIVERHGDWQIRCERQTGAPSEQCALIQNVQAQDRANVGLTVIFLLTADRQARILRVLAPLGVLLPSGLGLSIDGNEVGLAGFVRCVSEGCVAEVELEDGLIERFEAGETATFVIFQTPEEGIGIPISLNGFADGFAALENPPPPPTVDDEQVPSAIASVATQTRPVDAADAPNDRFGAAFGEGEADTRTALDQLMEDDLFPFAAGIAAVLVLILLTALFFLLQKPRKTRKQRREATLSAEAGTDDVEPRAAGRERLSPNEAADDVVEEGAVGLDQLGADAFDEAAPSPRPSPRARRLNDGRPPRRIAGPSDGRPSAPRRS